MVQQALLHLMPVDNWGESACAALVQQANTCCLATGSFHLCLIPQRKLQLLDGRQHAMVTKHVYHTVEHFVFRVCAFLNTVPINMNNTVKHFVW